MIVPADQPGLCSSHRQRPALLPAPDALPPATQSSRYQPGARSVNAALKLPGGSGAGSPEVFARGDAELGEYVAQVPLDSAGADKQLGGDLLVGVPVPGELGDLGLL